MPCYARQDKCISGSGTLPASWFYNTVPGTASGKGVLTPALPFTLLFFALDTIHQIAAGLTDPRNHCDAACPANLYTNMGILVWLAYIHAPIASAQELDTFLLLPDTTQAYQPEHTQPPFLHEKTTPRPQVTMIDQRQHTLFDRKA
ncbi:hypothetical protein CGLO_17007 [Colletotrichum gloeosporioides Cg-14]|uniref:Uncharacterized protein n=1 Tax=Colletotrichum gloeosporioides (strain Cg-14) TaxID=1237896 RepID=T0JXN2_COLGC|nr:hypothetical protein CGLO_17007 [Colletotrichum gloeosporioides Cg-14]